MSAPFITLLSGFGIRDAAAGIAKAVLMQHAPRATIVDISHSVAQNDLQHAAYLLLSAYTYFPEGSIHVLPLDIFTGTPPRLLLAKHEGYFFIAPDNGMLSLAFDEALTEVSICHEFTTTFSFNGWMHEAGRVIAAVSAGNATSFAKYYVAKVPRLLHPRASADSIDCNVLYIDRYENVVLDITKKQFDEMVHNRPFRIRLMRNDDITVVSNNYNDVPHENPLCRFNSAGFLEIAFNHGKAATALGLSGANAKHLRYRIIKIFTHNAVAPDS